MRDVHWSEKYLKEHPAPPALLPADATPAQRMWDAVRYVEANPRKWDQDSWGDASAVCGTTYCLAGHVVHRAGYRAVPDPREGEADWMLDQVPLDDLPADIALAAQEEGAVWGVPGVPWVVPVQWLATHLLGIDSAWAGGIWYCENNLDRVKVRVEQLFGPDPGVAP